MAALTTNDGRDDPTEGAAVTSAISTSGLTKDYGEARGIFDLDLDVHEGEAFGFIGPNGAGKTTTLRLLMDLIRADRGTATLLGMDSRRDSVAIKKVTGYLPGEPPEYPNHTGQRILDLLAHLRGGVNPQRVTEIARRLDLDLSRKYRQYSHGNKQKVWLVQTFMHDPTVLFLDEPTTGLDPVVQQAFRELVREARERGATVFLSSHVLPEVQEICDRIGVVHTGKLRQVGTLDELRIGNAHRVDAHTEREVDRAAIQGIAGVSDLTVTDHRVQCTVKGGLDEVVAVLHQARIVNLESQAMSLEEVFLAEYGRGTTS